jgi:hypothetical protein
VPIIVIFMLGFPVVGPLYAVWPLPQNGLRANYAMDIVAVHRAPVANVNCTRCTNKGATITRRPRCYDHINRIGTARCCSDQNSRA